jgi:hypothetical protein
MISPSLKLAGAERSLLSRKRTTRLDQKLGRVDKGLETRDAQLGKLWRGLFGASASLDHCLLFNEASSYSF